MNKKLSSSFFKIFSYLDLYPQHSGLSHKGKFKSSTIIGIIASLMIMTAMIVFSALFVFSVNNKNKRFSTSTLELRDSESGRFKLNLNSQEGPYIAVSWTHPELGNIMESNDTNASLILHTVNNSDGKYVQNYIIKEIKNLTICPREVINQYSSYINSSNEDPLTLY